MNSPISFDEPKLYESRVDAFRALLNEVERRAVERRIAVNRSRFIGRKRDLLTLFRIVAGEQVSEASMEEYMRSMGIKFAVGKGDDTLRQLFRKQFDAVGN